MSCNVCKDTGWVCENHAGVAWAGMTGEPECCGGAGMLCECKKETSPLNFIGDAQGKDGETK